MEYDREQQEDLASMDLTPKDLVDGVEYGDEWIQTYTGRRFYLNRPTPEMLDVVDIAHALGNLCRYTGHVRTFYSVAEHSVNLANWSLRHDPQHRRTVLFHDAAEAYIGDLSRPFKTLLPKAKEIEKAIQAAMAQRFDLLWPVPTSVKLMDTRIMLDEKAVLMHHTGGWNIQGEQPLGNITIHGWNPDRAAMEFLRLYSELKKD